MQYMPYKLYVQYMPFEALNICHKRHAYGSCLKEHILFLERQCVARRQTADPHEDDCGMRPRIGRLIQPLIAIWIFDCTDRKDTLYSIKRPF
jgi:hypothetical protein